MRWLWTAMFQPEVAKHCHVSGYVFIILYSKRRFNTSFWDVKILDGNPVPGAQQDARGSRNHLQIKQHSLCSRIKQPCFTSLLRYTLIDLNVFTEIPLSDFYNGYILFDNDLLLRIRFLHLVQGVLDRHSNILLFILLW